MTVRIPFWQRALVVLVPLAVAALPAYDYVVSHDLGRTVRQFTDGKPPTWPPARKAGTGGGLDGTATQLLDTLLATLRLGVLGVLAFGAGLLVARALNRRRRARELVTYELRPSQNDVSHPFRVREAFEGILGALSARWYERLWRGQDHFALEAHRLADESVRFTLALPRRVKAVVAAPLLELYPDARLIEQSGRPDWAGCVVRLKKRFRYVLSLHTTRSYEHSFAESLAVMLDGLGANATLQLALCPAPELVHRRARKLLKQRERGLNQGDRRDPSDLGVDSVVEAKELAGALETQHRSLCYFDLRVTGEDPDAVRRVAGLFSQLRSENELARREMRLRRGLYVRRVARALPNPLPGWRRGVVSSSELATLWQLPGARIKHARIPRSSTRRAAAPTEVCRDPAYELMRDERGPVGIAPGDSKYGHALIGGQGGGKTSCLARHLSVAAADPGRAVVLIDGKGPLAQQALGMIPASRTAHYLDLAAPEVGFNPLRIGATPGATAAVFVQALIEANPPGAIQAASDSFLRQAIAAVCAVEAEPTLWHVYRMLDPHGQSLYRDSVAERLDRLPGLDFARGYWRREFPNLIAQKGFGVEALNPPRNKLERLISTRETDLLLRHPVQLDLAQIIARGQVLVVKAAKAHIGESNARLIMQLLLALLHRQLQAQHHRPGDSSGPRVSLLFDEAHNVLTPAVATMLAEGRSAGLEAVFAWQYSAQIEDEIVRSGVRSLLQSISIFRMRELDDARSLAGLAMDVYSDRITTDEEDQQRLRFSADDITRLETHHAINLWIANGTPHPGFIAQTLPWEDRYDQCLADHHRHAQHQRGGHYPTDLPAPLDERSPADAASLGSAAAPTQRATSSRRHTPPAPRGNAPRRPAAQVPVQLPLEEL